MLHCQCSYWRVHTKSMSFVAEECTISLHHWPPQQDPPPSISADGSRNACYLRLQRLVCLHCIMNNVPSADSHWIFNHMILMDTPTSFRSSSSPQRSLPSSENLRALGLSPVQRPGAHINMRPTSARPFVSRSRSQPPRQRLPRSLFLRPEPWKRP